MINENKQTACAAKKITVTQKDLPLSCPMPSMELWNAHPKVFLPVEEMGDVKCPYCGTEYEWVDQTK